MLFDPFLIIFRHQHRYRLQVEMIFRPPGHNACADQPCSLLCLPQPGHRHTCVCPDGVPTVTKANGEVQCECPTGYQPRNNTCVKTGKRTVHTAGGPCSLLFCPFSSATQLRSDARGVKSSTHIFLNEQFHVSSANSVTASYQMNHDHVQVAH